MPATHTTITLYSPDGSVASHMDLPDNATWATVDRVWESAASLADARGWFAACVRGQGTSTEIRSCLPCMTRGVDRLADGVRERMTLAGLTGLELPAGLTVSHA